MPSQAAYATQPNYGSHPTIHPCFTQPISLMINKLSLVHNSAISAVPNDTLELSSYSLDRSARTGNCNNGGCRTHSALRIETLRGLWPVPHSFPGYHRQPSLQVPASSLHLCHQACGDNEIKAFILPRLAFPQLHCDFWVGVACPVAFTKNLAETLFTLLLPFYPRFSNLLHRSLHHGFQQPWRRGG